MEVEQNYHRQCLSPPQVREKSDFSIRGKHLLPRPLGRGGQAVVFDGEVGIV